MSLCVDIINLDVQILSGRGRSFGVLHLQYRIFEKRRIPSSIGAVATCRLNLLKC